LQAKETSMSFQQKITESIEQKTYFEFECKLFDEQENIESQYILHREFSLKNDPLIVDYCKGNQLASIFNNLKLNY
jgi:hypothetical protein